MTKIEEALSEFHGLQFYESADVNKTRKSKLCDVCNNEIPKSSHHLGYRFYADDGDWPVFVVCDNCAKTHKADLHLIEEHENN